MPILPSAVVSTCPVYVPGAYSFTVFRSSLGITSAIERPSLLHQRFTSILSARWYVVVNED